MAVPKLLKYSCIIFIFLLFYFQLAFDILTSQKPKF